MMILVTIMSGSMKGAISMVVSNITLTGINQFIMTRSPHSIFGMKNKKYSKN